MINTDRALRKVGEFLVNEAKKNVTNQGIVGEEGGVELRNSLTYEVEGNTLYVGTNLFYAVWKEWGTGENHALHHDGRKGWWVYVKDPMALANYVPSTQSVKTMDEAIEVCNWLRAQGLDAYYTDGEDPRPFLQPALDNNKDAIKQIILNEIKEGLKNG